MQLIINGTIIGYDDFNHGLPASGAKSWREITEAEERGAGPPLEGEPRAQMEIARKHGVRFEQITQVVTTGGQSGWAFTVLVPDTSAAVSRKRGADQGGDRHHRSVGVTAGRSTGAHPQSA